ncbi:MAG: hemerythrin family protein [Myxococcales bacterium]
MADLECPDIGDPVLDQHHRRLRTQLLELVAAVNAGKVEAVSARLDSVVEDITSHFAVEEQLMVETAFPNASRHKEAHDSFVADARKFSKELETKGLTPNFRRWAVGRLLEWYRFHIVANDVELGRHLLKKR